LPPICPPVLVPAFHASQNHPNATMYITRVNRLGLLSTQTQYNGCARNTLKPAPPPTMQPKPHIPFHPLDTALTQVYHCPFINTPCNYRARLFLALFYALTCPLLSAKSYALSPPPDGPRPPRLTGSRTIMFEPMSFLVTRKVLALSRGGPSQSPNRGEEGSGEVAFLF
jgi:hypothetical protein